MDPEYVQTLALIAIAVLSWTIARNSDKQLQEMRAIKSALLGGLFVRDSDGAFSYSELSEIRSMLRAKGRNTEYE